MWSIFFLLLVLGLIFCVRWFSHHKFEHWDGVPASQQLDFDFWAGMLSFVLALIFGCVAALC